MAETLHKVRRWSRKYGDVHKIFGFKTYGHSQDDIASAEYSPIANEVDNYFGRSQKVAGTFDAADFFLKPLAGETLNTFIDYWLFNAFQAKDWAYCRNRSQHVYDWGTAGRRLGQAWAGAILKSPDTAIDGVRKVAPFLGKARTKYLPWKLGFVTGIMLERADEWYAKRDIAFTIEDDAPTPTFNFKTYMKDFLTFLREAKEDEGIVGKFSRGEVPESYRNLFSKYGNFVEKHPYIHSALLTAGMMYLQGYWQNDWLDRKLAEKKPSLALVA